MTASLSHHAAAILCLAACGSDGDPAEVPADAPTVVHRDCTQPYPAEPDQDLGPTDGFDENGDTPMPQKVIAWMEAQSWHQQHDDWHNVRRWDQQCRGLDWSTVADRNVPQCAGAQRLADRGLSRAPIQEGAPGDGYAFLLMHRHMIQSIKQAFPGHGDLFAGFVKVPRDRTDPYNPNPNIEVRWSADQLRAIETLEDIEDHLDQFPTEDDLALYMEAPFRWTLENPSAPTSDASNGIHFALHAQWSILGSPIALGSGLNTISNRVFWKLHGWLDDVWQRYRQARGLSDSDPRYQAALLEQCEEMHHLSMAVAQ